MSRSEINNRLKNLDGWSYDKASGKIVKDFKFKNFQEAIAFVLRVAFEAEKSDHHPDILIEYNRVRLSLRTHSENGITDRDFELASRIDKFDFEY